MTGPSPEEALEAVRAISAKEWGACSEREHRSLRAALPTLEKAVEERDQARAARDSWKVMHDEKERRRANLREGLEKVEGLLRNSQQHGEALTDELAQEKEERRKAVEQLAYGDGAIRRMEDAYNEAEATAQRYMGKLAECEAERDEAIVALRSRADALADDFNATLRCAEDWAASGQTLCEWVAHARNRHDAALRRYREGPQGEEAT